MKLANSSSNVLKNNHKAKVLKASGQLLQQNVLRYHSVFISITDICQGRQCGFVSSVVEFAAMVIILFSVSVMVRCYVSLFFQASCVL